MPSHCLNHAILLLKNLLEIVKKKIKNCTSLSNNVHNYLIGDKSKAIISKQIKLEK